MKCDNCNRDLDCYIVPIFYAMVISKVANDEIIKFQSTTTTVTKYGEIKKREYKICNDCTSHIQKRNIQRSPLYSLITLTSIGIIVKLIEVFEYINRNTFNIVLYVLCGLFIIFSTSSVINLSRKRYLKVYKTALYYIAKNLLNIEFKKQSSKTEYAFWDSYPDSQNINMF